MSDQLDALQRTFAGLRAKYEAKLPGTVTQIEEHWRRLLAAGAPGADLADLIQVAHNISGNAKTFGFEAAGDAARAIELCLEPAREAGRMPDPSEQARVESLLVQLKAAATAPGVP